MPFRFALTGDRMVLNHVDNAVEFLWSSNGVAHVANLNLTTSARQLLIPDNETLLLMGTSKELRNELNTLKGAGIDGFANQTQNGGLAFMKKLSARKWTTDRAATVPTPHEVTVIGLLASGATYNKSWTIFGVTSPSITIDELLAELPRIKKRG